MPWLKLLHLAAVIVWSGALLYLPAALAPAPPLQSASDRITPDVPRRVFIGVATPAALVAIMSGSAIILIHGSVAPWLVLKLGFVGVLVLAHGACAWLALRAERHAVAGAARAVVSIAAVASLLATATIVLLKPTFR